MVVVVVFRSLRKRVGSDVNAMSRRKVTHSKHNTLTHGDLTGFLCSSSRPGTYVVHCMHSADFLLDCWKRCRPTGPHDTRS